MRCAEHIIDIPNVYETPEPWSGATLSGLATVLAFVDIAATLRNNFGCLCALTEESWPTKQLKARDIALSLVPSLPYLSRA